MADNTLATLAIEFEAKLEKLKQEFAQVKAEAAKAGQEIGDSIAQGVTPGVERAKVETASLGEQIKTTTKEATSFKSSFSQIAGAAGSVAAAIQSVITVMEYYNQVFGDGKVKADEFIATLSTNWSKDAASNLDKLRGKIQEVESELAFRMEGGFLDWFKGRSRETIETELEQYRALAKGAADQVENLDRQRRQQRGLSADMERRTDLHKELGALQAAASAGTEAELTAAEKITKTLEDRKDLIKDLREALPDEAGFQKELDRVEKVFEGIAERAGKKLGDEAAKAINKAAAEASKLFGAQMSSAVSAMRNQFDQVASSVGRLMEIAESQHLNGKR